MKKNLLSNTLSYDEMNRLAEQSVIGARGISVIPFGNGAERILEKLAVVEPENNDQYQEAYECWKKQLSI